MSKRNREKIEKNVRFREPSYLTFMRKKQKGYDIFFVTSIIIYIGWCTFKKKILIVTPATYVVIPFDIESTNTGQKRSATDWLIPIYHTYIKIVKKKIFRGVN